MSSILMIGSAFLTTLCVSKLIQVGLKHNLYSYSLVVERIFGHKTRILLDFMIATTQFSFSISQHVFVIRSLKTSFDIALNQQTTPWIFGCGILLVLTPISWVRNISKFSFSFMVGNLLILLTAVVLSVFSLNLILHQGVATDIKAYNSHSLISTLGFSIYSFEGIAVVMPIMQSCANP